MSNGKNPKKLGLTLLQKTQVLSQNNAISTQERASIAFYIREGMATGNFENLKCTLFEILETTKLPEIVEEMIISI